MEVERERREEEDEEVEKALEEEGGDLEGRQRRRRKKGGNDGVTENKESPLEVQEKVDGGGGGQEVRSVHYDPDHGKWKCQGCSWTCQLSGPRRCHIQNHEGYSQVLEDVKSLTSLDSLLDSPVKGSAMEYLKTEGIQNADEVLEMRLRKEDQHAAESTLVNEKLDFKFKELNGQETISVDAANQISRITVVENGSTSHEGHREDKLPRSEHVIVRDEQTTIVEKSKLRVEDLDLERVLEEQDTHDLYCPNCNSCITRRVILRKRKRTVRASECDAPAKKIHEVQQIEDSNSVSAGSQDREPDVFRCLSCFSFFIPTEGGFNIFRIFDKREESLNRQSLQQTPERNTNWILSMFKLGANKRTENEPGSINVSGEQIGDLAQNAKQPVPAAIVSQAVEVDRSPNTTEKYDAGEFSTIDVEKVADASTKGKQILATTISGSTQWRENRSSIKESNTGAMVHGEYQADRANNVGGVSPKKDAEDNIIHVVGKEPSQSNQGILQSVASADEAMSPPEVKINVVGQTTPEVQRKGDFEVLKSIVYGGLIESITSLVVLSSAIGSDASTLKIVALGLANLIGGLFVFVHNLWELKRAPDEATDQNGEPTGRYWELLGRKANFWLHATVAMSSFILFGLLPPLVYGFSFRESDNKEYKLIAVAAVSLFGIALLALGKAHVTPQKAYCMYLSSYLSLGVTASALPYVAGVMINRLLMELGLFDHSSAAPAPPLMYAHPSSVTPAWASL